MEQPHADTTTTTTTVNANWAALKQVAKTTKTTHSTQRTKRPHPSSSSTPNTILPPPPPAKRTRVVELDHSQYDRRSDVPNSLAKLGKYIAIDCEFVGVGKDGTDNALARASLVNYDGECVYDKFVRPPERVVDFRSHVSGVRPSDLKASAIDLAQAQKEVAELLKGRILVGHSLNHDLQVLMLSHPHKDIRDTSKYRKFRKLVGGRTPSLKVLAQRVLGLEIQSGEHSSVEDARSTMMLFKHVRNEWERIGSKTETSASSTSSASTSASTSSNTPTAAVVSSETVHIVKKPLRHDTKKKPTASTRRRWTKLNSRK